MKLSPDIRVTPHQTETKNTTCYMCACRCGIRVTLRDGEIRYIEGNPEHPLNKGVICAKGASGIIKQYSPARLTKPLLRKVGSDRRAAEFDEIGWDEAFSILEQRLAEIRRTDPKKFALFTGRDQMQALTGLFAKQFGTPNYAAHGGFCSVNMAAGMIYSIGGSFWEFGGPDLDRARLFVMIGTAEDHHSNPLKIAISKFKRSGGRFISINPVRTGYSAIADEWVPIKPGTDGALMLALYGCTGMIYACVKFLQEWSTAWTLVNFTLLGTASGFVLASAVSATLQVPQSGSFVSWALVLTTVGMTTRLFSFYRNTQIKSKSTIQSAIGVKHRHITQRSMGHTGGSFNTRAFFHHCSDSLIRNIRLVVIVMVFIVPILLLLVYRYRPDQEMLWVAFGIQFVGLLAERWLFFAQANHPQNLYYQTVS